MEGISIAFMGTVGPCRYNLGFSFLWRSSVLASLLFDTGHGRAGSAEASPSRNAIYTTM